MTEDINKSGVFQAKKDRDGSIPIITQSQEKQMTTQSQNSGMFKSGTSGNAAGKPKGAKSLKTASKEARELLTSVMRDQSLTLGLRVQAACALVEPRAAVGKVEAGRG